MSINLYMQFIFLNINIIINNSSNKYSCLKILGIKNIIIVELMIIKKYKSKIG